MVLGMLFLEGLNHTSYFWPETCLLLSLFPVVVFPKTTETDTRLTLEQTSLTIYNGNLVGEGNGSPLQYSCLENPMDGGAW